MDATRTPLALLSLFLLGCAAGSRADAEDATTMERPATEPADSPSPWLDPAYTPPTGLETGRVRLEPLAGRHVELDYAALMGSREHLQRTLHWGSWPRPDFTVEENLEDLERHWAEFQRREGYAFTVLAPDGSRCLGCIYIKPAGDPAASRDAMLAYWVVEEQVSADLDRHLLAEVLAWIGRDWPFGRVAVLVHEENARGAELARSLGLEPLDGAGPEGNVPYAWERGGT